MDFGIVRRFGQGLFVTARRIVKKPLIPEHIAEVIERLDVVRSAGQNVLVGPLGLFKPTQIAQRQPQIEPRRLVAGIDFNRPLKGSDRVFLTPKPTIGQPQIARRIAVLRIILQGQRKEARRFAEVAARQSDQPEHMGGDRVAGPPVQYAPIEGLRLSQAIGLVMLQS